MEEIRENKIEEETKTKSGFAALVGRPNVGKSTLMNRLIGQKIAITSNKPQTTRNRIQTVYTDERGQIVFLDTPGIHQAKNRLGEFMVEAAERTLKEADLVMWLVEPVTYIGAGEQHILEKLQEVKTPVILVMNKCDTVSKENLLKAIDVYRKAYSFAEVVPVSAFEGTNTDTLMDVLFQYMKEGPMFYDEDTVTDQPMREIAAELIREKALRCLSDEVPHGIAVTIERMEERKDGIFDIDANIICEKDSHKGIIIGKGGQMLKKIGTQARRSIEEMVEAQVNLKLWVKVRKEWRDSDMYLKSFGYRSER
ncbi:MAG: GTPase Era [Verrucomicrobia bacterium]|nr:GTPase Era [Lachnospiraceae bacterium]MBR4249594.1 GTPase Era [Verrucomicrobiota bacterium]